MKPVISEAVANDLKKSGIWQEGVFEVTEKMPEWPDNFAMTSAPINPEEFRRQYEGDWLVNVPLDGEPCGHKGCLNHVTHPCEGCGGIAGRMRL